MLHQAPRANPMKIAGNPETPNYLIPKAPPAKTISFLSRVTSTHVPLPFPSLRQAPRFGAMKPPTSSQSTSEKTLPAPSRVTSSSQAPRYGDMKIPQTSNQSAPANNPEPEYNPFVLQFEEMEFQRHLFSTHICDVAPNNLLRQAVKLPDGITRVCWANAIMQHALVGNILLTYDNLEKLIILLNKVKSNGCDMLHAVNAIGLYSQVSVGIIECEQLENEDDIITCPIHGDKSKPTIWFAVYGKKYPGATHWMPASLTE